MRRVERKNILFHCFPSTCPYDRSLDKRHVDVRVDGLRMFCPLEMVKIQSFGEDLRSITAYSDSSVKFEIISGP